MKTFISLGRTCQPAFQIRRITNNEHAHFFDWLITPADSIEIVLNKFDEDRFMRSSSEINTGLQIVDKGLRVLCPYTKVKFQHEFPSVNGKIDPGQIEHHLNNIRQKYLFLRERTLSTIRGRDPVVFIICQWKPKNAPFKPAETLELIEKGISRHRKENNTYYVLASEGLDNTVVEENRIYYKLDEYTGSEGSRWQGNDQSYDALFKLINSSF